MGFLTDDHLVKNNDLFKKPSSGGFLLQKEVISPRKRYETSAWDPSCHLTARFDRDDKIVTHMQTDHRPALSACTIDAIIVVSAPRPARIVMPSTSISMIPESAFALQRPALRSRPRAGAGTTVSTTAGTNCTSSDSECPPAAPRN
jgi:hypothetical protein